MRTRGFTSLAIIATVTALALAAVAVQVLPTVRETRPTRRRPRRRRATADGAAGSSRHLDELRFDAVRSAIASQRQAWAVFRRS